MFILVVGLFVGYAMGCCVLLLFVNLVLVQLICLCNLVIALVCLFVVTGWFD